MTTYVEARDALMINFDAGFAAAHPGVPVVYENTDTVDLDTVGDRFLRVEIEFTGAVQITIGDQPHDRTYGYFTIFLMTKEGLGTRDTLALMDSIKEIVKFKNWSGVVLSVPKLVDKQCKDGWEGREFATRFWFNSIG